MKQLLMLIIAMILLGCASAPELTPDETIQISIACGADAVCMVAMTDKALADKMQELEDEREDARLVTRDELIVFLNTCAAEPDLVVMEIIYIGRPKLPNQHKMHIAMRKYGYPYTHENVHHRLRRVDVKCVDPRDVIRQLDRQLGGIERRMPPFNR